MNRRFLLILPALLPLFPAHADIKLLMPVVTVTCDRSRQAIVTVLTVPNTDYIFHFTKLPPAPKAMTFTRHTISTQTAFTGLAAGSWTLEYDIPAKGSPTKSFAIPDCRYGDSVVTQVRHDPVPGKN